MREIFINLCNADKRFALQVMICIDKSNDINLCNKLLSMLAKSDIEWCIERLNKMAYRVGRILTLCCERLAQFDIIRQNLDQSYDQNNIETSTPYVHHGNATNAIATDTSVATLNSENNARLPTDKRFALEVMICIDKSNDINLCNKLLPMLAKPDIEWCIEHLNKLAYRKGRILTLCCERLAQFDIIQQNPDQSCDQSNIEISTPYVHHGNATNAINSENNAQLPHDLMDCVPSIFSNVHNLHTEESNLEHGAVVCNNATPITRPSTLIDIFDTCQLCIDSTCKIT